MSEDLEQIGLHAVDRFITTFNSRDVSQWADSLNFPHVRPSPHGPIAMIQDKESYIRMFDYKKIIATGWDHSEWDYKRILHISHNKIHAAGQWSRYNSQGDKILATPIVYIVTHHNGHWGIQSRFGSDLAANEDTSKIEKDTFDLVEDFIAKFNSGNTETSADLLNYPFYSIGIGELSETTSKQEFKIPDYKIELISLITIQAGRKSTNVGLDVILTSSQESLRRQLVINVTNRDNHLGIQAWSMLDPDD